MYFRWPFDAAFLSQTAAAESLRVNQLSTKMLHEHNRRQELLTLIEIVQMQYHVVVVI